MTTPERTDLDVACAYIRRGWQPIPYAQRTKAPEGPDAKGWHEWRFTEADIPARFGGMNLGILLGEPSGRLVDVDLDAIEAVRAADLILPNTDARFGRKSKPRSHRLFICESVPKTVKFEDPKPPEGQKPTLVELRGHTADGRPGLQTMFPPSIHPCGETVEWDLDGTPAVVEANELLGRVRRLAAVALLARQLPSPGKRNDMLLALCGWLLRAKWNVEMVEEIIYAVAVAGGIDDASKRRTEARKTAARLEKGGPVRGKTWLAKTVGPEVLAKAQEWLGVSEAKKDEDEKEDLTIPLTEALDLPQPEIDGRPFILLGLRRMVSGIPMNLLYRVRLTDSGELEAEPDRETVVPPDTAATEGALMALKCHLTLADAYRALLESADPYIFFLRPVEYRVRALAVLASYFREIWAAIPYLDFRSAAAGVGKTTGGQVCVWQSWHGFGAVNPTAAVICRVVASSGAVAMVDEVDKMFVKRGENADVLALLLSGYRRGISVPRMNMDVTPPRPEFYDGFQLKVITHRRPMPWELESRCIPFSMVKCGTAKQLKGDPSPAAFRDARDLCYAVRLLHFDAVKESYAALLSDPPLRDRQADLFLPLLALARLTDTALADEILAEARRDEGQRTLAQDPLVADLLRVLSDLGGGEWPLAEITKRLNGLDKEREKPIYSKTVAGLLEGLGFERSLKRTDNRVHFHIDPDRLKVWQATYLYPEMGSPPPKKTTPPMEWKLWQLARTHPSGVSFGAAVEALGGDPASVQALIDSGGWVLDPPFADWRNTFVLPRNFCGGCGVKAPLHWNGQKMVCEKCQQEEPEPQATPPDFWPNTALFLAALATVAALAHFTPPSDPPPHDPPPPSPLIHPNSTSFTQPGDRGRKLGRMRENEGGNEEDRGGGHRRKSLSLVYNPHSQSTTPPAPAPLIHTNSPSLTQPGNRLRKLGRMRENEGGEEPPLIGKVLLVKELLGPLVTRSVWPLPPYPREEALAQIRRIRYELGFPPLPGDPPALPRASDWFNPAEWCWLQDHPALPPVEGTTGLWRGPFKVGEPLRADLPPRDFEVLFRIGFVGPREPGKNPGDGA